MVDRPGTLKKAPRQRRETEYDRSTTTIRVSLQVKDHIEKQGRHGESHDHILRRVFKLPAVDWKGRRS